MAEFERTNDHPSDETLAAFLDGTLDDAGKEQVMGHLAVCDECRAFAADWAKAVVLETAGERGAVSVRVGEKPAGERRVESQEVRVVEGIVTCANCRKNVGGADSFCRYCGAPLKAESMPRATAESILLYEYGALVTGIVCFIISFFVPRFFWQFLIAFAAFEGLYVYFRMKREILLKLIDALRSGDKGREEEILQRLRKRFKA